MSDILLFEQAAPATPSVNQVVLYPKADGLMYSKYARLKPRARPPEVIPEHWIVFAGGIVSQEEVGRPSIELVPMPVVEAPVEWIPVAIKVRKPKKVVRRPVHLTLAPPLTYRDRGAEDDEDMLTLFREAA